MANYTLKNVSGVQQIVVVNVDPEQGKERAVTLAAAESIDIDTLVFSKSPDIYGDIDAGKLVITAGGSAHTQKITLDADIITGNKCDVILNGLPVAQVPYSVSHNNTMTAWASAIQAMGGITAAVTAAREITVTDSSSGRRIPLTGAVISGGASQAGAVITTTVQPYLVVSYTTSNTAIGNEEPEGSIIETDITTKIATHSALTTGVHGVGGGTVAKVADIATDANLSVAAQAVVTAGACDVDANLSTAAQAVVTAGACDVDANLSTAAQAVVTAGACDVDANLSSIGQNALASFTAMGRIVYWNSALITLQALITSLTGSAAAPYTIMIPPGTYTLPAALYLKPFVNLKGAGGRGRITILASQSCNVQASDLGVGVNRIRLDGIRFESCPLNFINADATKTLLVEMDDCPCNSNSPIIATGNAYGSALTMVNLSLRNMNVDKNAAPQMFTFTKLYASSCSLLGMYFTDSDGIFDGCTFGVACNLLNAGTAGGWFEFNNCKLDTMVVNDPTSESVLATLCGAGAGNENVQVSSLFKGNTAPASIAGFIKLQPGAVYFCWADKKLYRKTADVGTNTWVESTA